MTNVSDTVRALGMFLVSLVVGAAGNGAGNAAVVAADFRVGSLGPRSRDRAAKRRIARPARGESRRGPPGARQADDDRMTARHPGVE